MKLAVECSCGSKMTRYPLKDGYGIFLTYACYKCEKEKWKGFRSDIHEHYQAEEAIEEE